MKSLPAYHEFFNPLLKALKLLGGSGSIEEINDKVIELMRLPAEVLEATHDPEIGNQTEVAYRLAWARSYLKKYGLLDNSVRGVWSLTNRAETLEQVEPREIVKFVRNQARRSTEKKHVPAAEMETAIEGVEEPWRVKLHRLLTTELAPAAFERLIQRVLRESGFVQVEVTGRTGDGGIDGKGIAKIHGLLSFHVVFQCKRYKNVVSPSQIRDFRGAMVGRADRGLFITTGTFTRDAVKEATRNGAPPIDLLDGDQLAAKLKELGLGIKTSMVERADVDQEWFKGICVPTTGANQSASRQPIIESCYISF